jgi:2-phosphoglycerate kinase
MIYLIGGPPRVGKSTLAKMLANEKAIPYISTDDIAAVIMPYIPAEEFPAKLPLSFLRKETNFSNDLFFSKYSAEQIVGFYLRQAEALWPGFKSFIKYALDDDHDFVVEGWAILPNFVRTIISPDNEKKIRTCFLYKQDPLQIVPALKSSEAKNDWVINNTKEEATFFAIAKMVSYFGNLIMREAEECDLEAVDMGSGFSQKTEALAKSL